MGTHTSDQWEPVLHLPTLPALDAVFPRYAGLADDALNAVARAADESFSGISFPHTHARTRRGLTFKKPVGTVVLCLPWPDETIEIEVFVTEGHVCLKEVNDIVQGFREELLNYKAVAA